MEELGVFSMLSIKTVEKLNSTKPRFPIPDEHRIHSLRDRIGYLAVDSLDRESTGEKTFTELDAARILAEAARRMNLSLESQGRTSRRPFEFKTGSDGVGGKLDWYMDYSKRFESLEIVRNVIFDLVAMVCDDLLREGFTPERMGIIIDIIGDLSEELVQEISYGYAMGGDQSGVLIDADGSEFAHGRRKKIEEPNRGILNAYAIPRPSEKEARITKDMIKQGQYIIALYQEGMMRSNGATLVRDMAQKAFGEEDYINKMSEDMLKDIAKPSQPYTPLLHYLMGDEDNLPALPSSYQKTGHGITGFIHVTGGGIWLKGSRFLAGTGLSMFIDNQFAPSEFSNELQRKSSVSGDTVYGVLSAGNGGYLVVESWEQAVEALEKIKEYNETETSRARAFGEQYSDIGLTRAPMPVRAQIAGQVIETPEGESPFILLRNKTADAGEKRREYYKYYIP
ncbi:MAG: hypothetical protein UW24_C0010G0007 [Parcubacteria group bacterium GW2011_GWA2_44_12]|nr:MAG: hypothetical protein UW24_C0010G0007 [Parcubacteria group bacterium GW2011_GWA2_44_12]